jgi:signal transduction histidine kinase
LAGVIALVASLIVAFLLARSVYRPVRKLTVAADEIASGDYQQRIDPVGPAEIKDLSASFNRMSHEINLSHGRLKDLIADVSHQLRSPLTSIQGFARAILDGTAKDRKARENAAEIIIDESQRMLKQVNGLLELSRLQTGEKEINKERIDLAEIIGYSVESYSYRAKERGIKLEVNTGKMKPIMGDPDRLEQTISNLLDNAVKFTPSGGWINVDAKEVEQGIEIAVADSGPGIPPEKLEHVFERFYQASGRRGGLGLGLAIVREIVEAHDGTVRVESEFGKGSRFIILLPKALKDSPETK